MLKLSRNLNIARPVVTLSCLGFLVAGMAVFTGCGGGSAPQEEAKKEPPMIMSVEQIDQVTTLDDKVADGQYLVAKVALRNNTNNTLALEPSNFVLQNITDNEKERYSQPAERGMTSPIGKTYGAELKSKVIDYETTNLYPRMQVERYFVFMVPSDASVNGYQITYTPAKISTPLVTSEATAINDHRNQSAIPSNEQPTEPNKP